MSSPQPDEPREQVTKLVEESGYLAKVRVTLIHDETEWSPYLSHDDMLKLDDVREALRRGDVKEAAHHGEVFKLKKVA